MEKLITRKEAAKLLGISLATLDEARNSGLISYIQYVPNGCVYITNLIHSSVDPKTVQYLAGHKSSKITMDIYAKVKYNKPDQLAGLLNSAFVQWDADSCGAAQ